MAAARPAPRLSPLRDLPWLFGRILRAVPGATALWALLILADAAFTALQLWAVRGTVNAVVATLRGGAAPGALALWFVRIAAVQGGTRLAALLRPFVRERVRVGAGFALQDAALDQAARLSVETFDKEGSHDLTSRVAAGADSRGPDLVAEALGLCQQVPSVVVYAAALGAIALWLPFAAAAMEGVFVWQMVAQAARERAFQVDWTRQRRLTDYYAHLLTSRAPASEVRLFGLRPEILRRWRQGQRAYALQRHRLALREAFASLPSVFFGSVFLVAAVAAVAAFHGRVEPGLAAIFLTALFGVMAGMNTVQQSVRRFVDHAGYAADLRALLEDLPAEDAGAAPAAMDRGQAAPGPATGDTPHHAPQDGGSARPAASTPTGAPAPAPAPPGTAAAEGAPLGTMETTSPAHCPAPSPVDHAPTAPVTRTGDGIRPARAATVPPGEMPPPGSGVAPSDTAWLPFPRPLRHGFRLQGVCYRYPGAARDALRGIDAEIRAGEMVALVGPNGAGKSTLSALLLGLRRPSAGRITADGVDLGRIPPAEVRAACAAVFQQPVRYPATLRANVALARAEAARDAALEPALRAAGLEDARDQADRLLSPEFGGIDLSGGQWQRLSIARALFRPEAQVLVFDEPTAALDPLAELALFERFAALSAGRTTLLISHRLGPTRLADRVMVLEGGALVEEGPPDRLLAAGGRFAQLFAAQGAWYR